MHTFMAGRNISSSFSEGPASTPNLYEDGVLCNLRFSLIFMLLGHQLKQMELLKNGTCNVFASDISFLPAIASSTHGFENFIVGNQLKTKEPLAAVTRNNDREFSDIVNWVIQALYYGEEQGLTKDLTLCENHTNFTYQVSDLDFLDAVHCVGNYGNIHDGDKNSRGMNQINNGTTGMLYAIPFNKTAIEYDGSSFFTDGSDSNTL